MRGPRFAGPCPKCSAALYTGLVFCVGCLTPLKYGPAEFFEDANPAARDQDPGWQIEELARKASGEVPGLVHPLSAMGAAGVISSPASAVDTDAAEKERRNTRVSIKEASDAFLYGDCSEVKSQKADFCDHLKRHHKYITKTWPKDYVKHARQGMTGYVHGKCVAEWEPVNALQLEAPG